MWLYSLHVIVPGVGGADTALFETSSLMMLVEDHEGSWIDWVMRASDTRCGSRLPHSLCF